jgi:GNAT superfamily N-acetyltransferase
VLAFTQNTFQWGDYIDWVWDEWIADPRGSMIVGEVDGRVIGLDMMSVPRPGEGWFQGLRIDPAYRGRGYARRFEQYQLAEARRRGLHTVRFLTAEDNTPVHKNAVRHGFRPLGHFLYHQARRDDPATQAALAAHPARELAPLDPAARDAAWEQVPRGPLWAPSAGCLGGDWAFAAFTRAWWDELVAGGRVWTAPGGGVIIASPLRPNFPGQDSEWLAWLDPGPTVTPAAVAALVVAAMSQAFDQGYDSIGTMWPRVDVLEAGLRLAGWQSDPALEETMLLFEVEL